MRMYFKYADNTFSDSANYPTIPPSRDGGQWVAGEPDGLELHVETTVATKLMEKFKALPDDARGVFWPLREGIRGALAENDLSAVKKLIELSLIPEAYEPYRAAFLVELGAV